MKVADQMDDEAQRLLPVGAAGLGVLEYRCEPVERLECIAFRRRAIIDDAVEVHVVPRHRGLLPELARRRAHFVGPVGGFVEALAGPEDLLDLGAGEARKLSIGDRRNDAVPGLAPRQSG